MHILVVVTYLVNNLFMAAPPHSRRSITRARTMYRYWGIEELHITHLRTQIQNKLGAYCQFK